jgi:hypothetical protein
VGPQNHVAVARCVGRAPHLCLAKSDGRTFGCCDPSDPPIKLKPYPFKIRYNGNHLSIQWEEREQ